MGREDDKEDLNSCWMTLREKEDTGIWNRTLKIALSGQLALQQTMDMFEDRVRKHDDIEGAVYWILYRKSAN